MQTMNDMMNGQDASNNVVALSQSNLALPPGVPHFQTTEQGMMQ